jgi:hypothetical protein
MTLKFLALQGAPYIYDISRLRVKVGDRLLKAGAVSFVFKSDFSKIPLKML